LIRQAQQIHDRITISEMIYKAEIGVKPVVGETYYLYRKDDGVYIMSLVSPEEFGDKTTYTFISENILLADHTWEVLRKVEDIYI